MNDNENRQDDLFEENASAVNNEEPEKQENTEASEPQQGQATFSFPRPPMGGFNAEAKREEASAEIVSEQSSNKASEFNPYIAPKMQSDNFNANTYHYTSANLPNQDNREYTQQNSNQGYNPYQQPYQYNPQPYRQGVPEPPKKGKGKKLAGIIVAACIIVAVIALATSFIGGDKPSVTPSENTTASDSVGGADTGEITTAPVATTQVGYVEQINSVVVAEKVRPSVVGVITYYRGQLAGEGSGILWMEDGGYTYIITCAHVINQDGVTYGVLLLDGRSFEAELVAADARTDIGVVRIKEVGLPLAEIGDSTSLKIGEPVYAIGNPGGSEYFGSVTDGIVSAIDRSITSTYTMTCIQHNAAINPGNSGGALVNTSGQIVGINSSKIASTEYEGMGFAVPMSIALPVAQALVQHKYVPNRPKLGIEYADVSSYQLYSMVVSIKGLPSGSLVIAGISKDSSLANTGAQVGDLIIAVNGKEMNDSSILLDLISTGAVGDTLTLTLCRIESRTYKTTTFDVTITLIEDKGDSVEETTTEPQGGYYYGGANDFEDFFSDYFGFGW